MYKLVVFFAVVAVVAAKPGFFAPAIAVAPAIETRTAILGEKTIESHGNSVVHASAPAVTSYAAAISAAIPAALPAVRTSVIAEKTIESHGNSVVHSSAPVVTGYTAPAIATYAAAAPAFTTYAAASPLLYTAPAYEKTITGYGSNALHGYLF